MQALETLGINGPSLLWHTINFLVLVALLWRFLYKPVVRMLDERSNRIKESMERAEEIKEQLARTNEETRVALEKARRDAQAVADQASQIGEQIKAQARKDAQAEAEKVLVQARQQIEQERRQAMTELRLEMANLVVAAAGKIIGRQLDDRSQHQLVEEFLRGDGARLSD
ncbi:MAG TPA: F0F1 ATP synthase subunit B [Chloroflexota bacterium]